ncbi:hypothetical protein QQ045_003566 [Rhodiola kirilowii]
MDKISRYLTFPVMFSHNKTGLFQFILQKVWKRVQGWKEKMLSMAGKENLIKAVIQAFPMYTMMCFKIPATLIKIIVSIVCKYWWSNGVRAREFIGVGLRSSIGGSWRADWDLETWGSSMMHYYLIRFGDCYRAGKA